SGSIVSRSGAPFATVRLDLASRIKVQQEVDGDAPEGVLHVAGGSRWRVDAEFDALTAPGLHPATTVGRDKLTGSAALAIAFGGTQVPIATGVVREIGVDEGSDTITVSMDGPESLTQPDLSLPSMGSYRAAASKALMRYPLNGTAVIIAALHRMGIRVTPAPRPDCVLSVPGIWGSIPDVGHVSLSGAGAPEGTGLWTNSRWTAEGLQSHASGHNAEITGWPSRWARWERTAAVQFGCDFQWDGVSSQVVLGVSLGPGEARISHFSDGRIQVGIKSVGGNSFTWTNFGALTGAGWRNYTATIQSTTTPGTVNIRIHVDGVQLGATTVVSGGTAVPSESDAGPVYIMQTAMTGRTRIELHHALGVGSLTYPTAGSTSVSQQAILEQSMLTLDKVPPIDARSPWEVITEIASAEMGEATFTEDGAFRYRKRSTVNANATPVDATISTDLASSVGGSASATSVRSKVVVKAQRLRLWEAGMGSGLRLPSHLHDEPIEIPSGKGSIIIDLDREIHATTGIITPISAAGMAADYPASWAICTSKAGTSLAPLTAVTASLHMIGPSTARIDYHNITSTMWAVWPSGWGNPPGMTIQPGDGSLVILGRHTLTDADIPRARVSTSDADTLAAWGERVFRMPESPWIQSRTTATSVANIVLAASSRPRVELEDITIPGDPRYQIGDVVTVTDTRSRWPAVNARVHGVEHEISTTAEGRMTTTLSLKTI
ncbi:MAG: hypothetical protein AB7G37_20250, partial [Solirubrobacteraceae bacterium]